MAGRVKLLVASSNPGKLREFQMLAADAPGIQVDALAGLAGLPSFNESAATFAENAAGKALHYSRFTTEQVVADDSGLVVAALGGTPGPRSARYAGAGASDNDRVKKLLEDLGGREGAERRARFVCALAIARAGRVLAVVSDAAEGIIAEAPRGKNGFGYDPIFLFEPLGRTFAELSQEEKNVHSHRGKAFRKLLSFLVSPEEFLLA